MESRWTPKISENDFRGQNSMACDVLYIIEKLLKGKCLKWARIAHLDIWNTSYGQKEGQESNCQFDSRPQKVRNRSDLLSCKKLATYLESSRQGLQLCFRRHLDPRSTRKVTRLQSCGSSSWRNFETPTRESREKKVIWMWAPWRGVEYTIKGKVVASPKSGPWWVLCVHVARDSS